MESDPDDFSENSSEANDNPPASGGPVDNSEGQSLGEAKVDTSKSYQEPGGSDPPDTCSVDEGQDVEPADALCQLLEEIRPLEDLELPEMRTILARAVKLKLPPGEQAVLAGKLSKKIDLSASTISKLLVDEQNRFAELGVLHNAELVTKALCSGLEQLYQKLAWCGGCLWHQAFDGGKNPGYFEKSTPQDVESLILQEYNTLPSMNSRTARQEVIRRVASQYENEHFFDDVSAGVSVKNGFLRLDRLTGEVSLLSASPDFKTRYVLPFEYDPDATAPNFSAGLARNFPDEESVQALAEYVGCALLGATPGRDNARHILLLIGPKNGGKSTLLDVVRLLVPPYTVSAESPSAWSNEYHRAMLQGCAFNIISELGITELKETKWLKAISSHEPVTARLPYCPPSSFRPTCWNFFASNTVPRTNDRNAAFERRFLAIRTRGSLRPDEIDPDYLTKVAGELPGVLAFVLASACRAIRRGHFLLPSAHSEIMAEMQFGHDLIDRFVNRRIERAPEGSRPLPTPRIFAALLEFAQSEGVDTDGWTSTRHGRRIGVMIQDLYGAVRSMTSGVPQYRGVRLKST